jgi:hypothetical protein
VLREPAGLQRGVLLSILPQLRLMRLINLIGGDTFARFLSSTGEPDLWVEACVCSPAARPRLWSNSWSPSSFTVSCLPSTDYGSLAAGVYPRVTCSIHCHAQSDIAGPLSSTFLTWSRWPTSYGSSLDLTIPISRQVHQFGTDLPKLFTSRGRQPTGFQSGRKILLRQSRQYERR